MGMSTHIAGITPPDAAFQKMYDAYKACEDAGVQIPDEIVKYFQGELPDPKGMITDLTRAPFVTEYNEDSQNGLEVDLRKLPNHIKVIRFYNSY